MPVAPSAAVEENVFSYSGYSAIASLLDYSAGSFPVTFADRQVDVEQPDYHRADRFHGAPVGLQVMTRRLREEKAIGLMEIIKIALEQHS
ncbi:Acetamidase [Mycoblastus sanguinarius]|nr:Acetamidase [Mycoblastus sanguinarius]